MALIQCSECGRKVSDKAAACPGCGAPVELQTASAGATGEVSSPEAWDQDTEQDPVGELPRRAAGRRKKILVVGAAAVIAAVIAVVVSVVASMGSKDLCASTEGCTKHGECATVKDKDEKPKSSSDKKPTCRASSKSDCEHSQYCLEHGFCSIVAFEDSPAYGTCGAITEKDCRSSVDCTSNGYCTPRKGTACVTTQVATPIRQLAVGNGMFGGMVTCCAK